MTNQHPITPPPELVQQWLNADAEKGLFAEPLAAKAAQWGADQELKACLKWLDFMGFSDADIERLRAARRPKPPSLKEQALEALNRMDQFPTADDQHIIRCALEQIDD